MGGEEGCEFCIVWVWEEACGKDECDSSKRVRGAEAGEGGKGSGDGAFHLSDDRDGVGWGDLAVGGDCGAGGQHHVCRRPCNLPALDTHMFCKTPHLLHRQQRQQQTSNVKHVKC